MASSGQYRQYQPYQSLPGMGGPVMSNIHQPGSQLSMIPAMEVPRNYSGQQLMYSHNQAQTQSERPFKYDNMPSPNQYSHQPQQQHQQQQPDRSFKYDMTTPTYRQYQPQHQPYQPLPGMGSPIMSNIHQPGGQMSMIPAMGVPQGYNGQPIYRHNQPQPQSERPFKCDQCVQSFSRNHDLKRHKRIHLAVKPFPCSFCSKSFSRKDALKRHRLVKGCENKVNDGSNGNDGGTNQSVKSDGDRD